jgi:hypothetical protein
VTVISDIVGPDAEGKAPLVAVCVSTKGSILDFNLE